MSELTDRQKEFVADEMDKITKEKLESLSFAEQLLLFVLLDVMILNLQNAPFKVIKATIEILTHYVEIIDGLTKDNK